MNRGVCQCAVVLPPCDACSTNRCVDCGEEADENEQCACDLPAAPAIARVDVVIYKGRPITLYVNDTRVAGIKPPVSGCTTHAWTVRIDDLRRAIGEVGT